MSVESLESIFGSVESGVLRSSSGNSCFPEPYSDSPPVYPFFLSHVLPPFYPLIPCFVITTTSPIEWPVFLTMHTISVSSCRTTMTQVTLSSLRQPSRIQNSKTCVQTRSMDWSSHRSFTKAAKMLFLAIFGKEQLAQGIRDMDKTVVTHFISEPD